MKRILIIAIAACAAALSGCGSLFECDGYYETVYVQTQRCTAGYSSTGHCNGWTSGQKPVERCVRTASYEAPKHERPQKPSAQTLASQGYEAYEKGDDAQAVRLWRQAAEKGNVDGQKNLGWAYENGRGVEQSDAEAVRWYRLAAEQGDALAQYNLGGMYLFGRGVSQNSAEAARLFRLAAEQGEASAQKNLGLMYKNGDGVEQSDVEAVQWFRRAAEQDHGPAQFSLGLMYEEGRGVERNLDEAVRWYRKAAANGNKDAQTALKRLGVSS